MKKYGVKILASLGAVLLCAMCFVNVVSAASFKDPIDGARDALDTAMDMAGDVADDIKDSLTDMLDPENGEPEAEEDGIVDDDDGGKRDESTKDNDVRDTTDKSYGMDMTDTTDDKKDAKDTTDDLSEETTGVIEGMELEKKGINPWAIVIAVSVVVAVLVLIFILIPKKRS